MRNTDSLSPRSLRFLSRLFAAPPQDIPVQEQPFDVNEMRRFVDAVFCQQARREYEEALKKSDNKPEFYYPTKCEIEIHDDKIADVPVRIYQPKLKGPLPCILYFTGSGFAYSQLDWQQLNCEKLSRETGFICINMGERNAPEFPFPQGLNDAKAVLSWIEKYGEKLGINDQIYLCGFSSGGNFAAVLARWARDEKIKIQRQIIFSGFLNLSSIGKNTSYELYGEGFGLSKSGLIALAKNYIPEGTDPKNPDISPLLFSGNFEDIAPATIIVGACDPLLDENKAYADKLKSHGIEVDFRILGKLHEHMGPYAFELASHKKEDAIRAAAKSLPGLFKKKKQEEDTSALKKASPTII